METNLAPLASARVMHSIIDGTVLGAIAVRDFGLSVIGAVQLIQHGLNDHYALRSAEGDFILRVYRHGWRTLDDILWELSLIEHLAAVRVPVAASIRRTDGTWYSELAAPEGTRYVALFQRAPGLYTHFGNIGRHRVSPASCATQFGQSMAALHAASDSFKATTARFALDLETLLNQPHRAIEQVYAHQPQALEELGQLINQLHTILDASTCAQLNWGPCHGDITGGNSTFHNNQVIHFDFDCGGPGWRAYDLGVFYWSMAINDTPNRVWEQFLEGYRSHRSIGEADLATVHTFAAIQVIWLVGLWCQNAAVLGFHKVHDDYLDRELRRIREFTALAQRTIG